MCRKSGFTSISNYAVVGLVLLLAILEILFLAWAIVDSFKWGGDEHEFGTEEKRGEEMYKNKKNL